jgi:hypothetical protein
MKPRLRSVARWLLLVFASGMACNEYCEDQCQSEHEDCVANARGDDTKVDRCHANRDQCNATCVDQPLDANDGRH